MSESLGNWLKKERLKRKYTQEEVAREVGIKQSTYSLWERNKISLRLEQIILLIDYFGIALETIPVEILRGSADMKRLTVYELPAVASSLKTFDGEEYRILGFLGVSENGKVEKLTELYYSTRSVIKDDKLIAKRKKRTDELTLVNKPKKIKSKK